MLRSCVAGWAVGRPDGLSMLHRLPDAKTHHFREPATDPLNAKVAPIGIAVDVIGPDDRGRVRRHPLYKLALGASRRTNLQVNGASSLVPTGSLGGIFGAPGAHRGHERGHDARRMPAPVIKYYKSITVTKHFPC